MKREVPLIARQLLRLLLITYGLWLNTVSAQPSASFQQYYYYYKGAPGTFAPIINYTFGNNLYLEGRYNYEDINTGSIYIGKTFEIGSAFSVSFTPVAGAVFGFYKGGSLGANLYANYKGLNLSYQPQYTLSTESRESNFLYSWSDLSLDVMDNIAVGVSVQHTKTVSEKSLLEKGLMVQFSFKNWSLPIYAYNPQSSDRYFLIGLNYEWEGKKRKKKEENKEPVSSAPVLAKSEDHPRESHSLLSETKSITALVESSMAAKVVPVFVRTSANSFLH